MSKKGQGANVPAKKEDSIPVHVMVGSEDEMGLRLEPGDVRIPRLKICQKMSSKAQKNGIKVGEYYNDVTNEKVDAPFTFFPILQWDSVSYFTKKQEFKGTVYKNPATGERVTFGDLIDEILVDPKGYCEENNLRIIEFHNFMIVLEDELKAAITSGIKPQVYIISCGSAAREFSRQLIGKLFANSKKMVPIYGQAVTVETFEKEYDSGDAMMPRFSYPRFPTPDEFKGLKIMAGEALKLHTTATDNIANQAEHDPDEDQESPPTSGGADTFPST